MQDPKPVEAPSGGYSVVDAIVDGRLSLEDVIEQYRPATAGERAKSAGIGVYQGLAQAVLSGNASLMALEGKGLEAIGMKDLAKRFRSASSDLNAGRVGGADVVGAMGQPAPQTANDPWYWKMLTSEGPQALGSMAGMTLVPGPKGSKLKGLASMPTGGLAIATRGALTQASQGFHEALAAKADETTAWTAFAINALGGATEGLPGLAPRRIGEILNRVDRASGGGLKRAMLVGAKTGFGEAFQEAFQQTLSNAGAKVLYEEDRELLRGVVESGRGAFLVGLLAGGASGMAQPQQGAQGPAMRSSASGSQPGVEGAQAPQTRVKPLRVDLGSLDTETASAVKDFAADLGEVVHPVEDADPALVEFGKRRGVRVQFVESEDGTPLRRPAGYMRDGAVAIVDVNAPDALASLVDHEIGHHVLETVPGARERIVELLGPELRAAALAEYQQDIVASEIRKAGRDLTPEEIQAIEAQAAQIPEDEGITRLAEDFSPVIRLMRTNPEAFSKVEDVGFWRGIVRAVLDVGRSLMRRPSAAEQELAKRYRSLARRGQAARMDPKEGVEIARILTSFLDESVGQTRASTPQAQNVAQAEPVAQAPEAASPQAPSGPSPIPEPGMMEIPNAPVNARGRELLSKSDAELQSELESRLAQEDAILREQFPDKGNVWYERVADLRRKARDPNNPEGDRAALQLRRAGVKPSGVNVEEIADAVRAKEVLRGVTRGRFGTETKAQAQNIGQGPQYAAPRQTETPEFKAWFGDSKVVDASGKPLVVYHGTPAGKIDKFLPDGGDPVAGARSLELFRKAKARNEPFGYMNFRSGSFFSPDPEYAGNYTGENSGVMYPVYIKAENPVYMDQRTGKVTGTDPRKTPDALIMHDGGKINEVAVIEPEQIKSATGNRGTFDPNNPDIRFAAPRTQSNLPEERYGLAGDVVDGRTVRGGPVANTDSIGASLDDYEVLRGIREVPMSDFRLTGKHYSVSGTNKIKSLAEQIRQSGEISPLIVVVDKEGPYILEGATRAESLALLKAKSFPALVVIDRGESGVSYAAPRSQSNLPKQEDSRSARVRAYMQNALEPLRRVSQAAIEAGKTKRDPFLAESLRTSRSRTRIQDEKAALVDPLLKTIADSGVSMDDAEAFLLARAAPARNALVQARTGKPNGSGMTDAAAQAVTTAALSGPNAAGYQAIARDFDALTKRTRDLWESYGLESPEMIRSMEQQQPAYAPFRSEPDVEGKPRGAGRQIKGREFKAALGRSSMAENPITYAVEDLNRAIIRGETNQARQELYDFVKDVGDSGFAYVDVPPMKETLVNGSVRKVPDFQEAENEITLKVKGDLRRVRFTDPYAPIARALRGLDREQVPEVVQKVLRPLTKWPVAFSTRWNPFFPPVNFARDISGAALNEQSLKIVAPGALSRSAKEVFTKGPLYQRFRRAGGPVAFLDLQRTVEEVAADIRADVEKQTTGNDPRSWPRKTWAKYQEFVERNNDYAEAIVRLSGFRYAIEELGYSDAKAALFAKDLTTNFENRGQAAWINTLYAFSNANIQSLDKFTRVMKKPGARKLAFALAGAAYAMSAINRTVGGEDDDGIPYYDKIDPFTRRSSAILMNPSGDGTYIKIPLPFMWGWFHVLGDQMATAAYTGDTDKAFDAMVDATDQHFNFLGASPSFNQLVAPTALDPFVQASENKTFSGAPVYPSTFGDKTKPDSELAWDNTNKPLVEIVRWINKATGGTSTKSGAVDVSAITIENAFKAMFGGAGGEATRSAEVIRKIATGEDTTLNDIPLARRFMGEVSLRDSRRVFLDYSRLVDQAVKDEKAGNEYDARLYRMRLRIKGIKDRIGDLEDKVRASDSLSDRKQYQERIRALMVQGVELIRETQK